MPLLPTDEPHRGLTELVRHRTGPGPAPDPAGAGWPTASAVLDDLPLSAVLADRRSVREFADRAPTRADLVGVLAAAERLQWAQWPADRHGDPHLRLLVAAYRVSGLAEGLHAWRPGNGSGDGALNPVGDPGWLSELPGRYAPAPVLVLVRGSVRRVGAEGYHALLVRAGALGYAVWLAARTRGFECSVFGGASPEPSAGLSTDDDRSLAHLFTVAVGYPLTT